MEPKRNSHAIVETAEPEGEEGLGEMVARRLRSEIVFGDLGPNERIKQDAVAQRFDVSRLPVREALRELASEGLVSLERDVGARVTPLDPAELIEIYLVREAIEPLLVVEATGRIGPEELAAARAVNDESEACEESDDVPGYLRADRRFHEIIFIAAGMPRAHAIVKGIWHTAERYRHAYTILPKKLEISVIEHRMILEAIERGAAEDAGELHRVHTRRTRLTLAQHPEMFGERE